LCGDEGLRLEAAAATLEAGALPTYRLYV